MSSYLDTKTQPTRLNFRLPVSLTIALITLFIGFSSLLTNKSYEFKANYENLGVETVVMKLMNGRVKMHYIAKDTNHNVIKMENYFGFFLRLGHHYLLLQLDQDDGSGSGRQMLNIKLFFIMTHEDKNSVMISDQRGFYLTKEGKLLRLKGILYGKELDRNRLPVMH